jgi:hypothetical protein
VGYPVKLGSGVPVEYHAHDRVQGLSQTRAQTAREEQGRSCAWQSSRSNHCYISPVWLVLRVYSFVKLHAALVESELVMYKIPCLC